MEKETYGKKMEPPRFLKPGLVKILHFVGLTNLSDTQVKQYGEVYKELYDKNFE